VQRYDGGSDEVRGPGDGQSVGRCPTGEFGVLDGEVAVPYGADADEHRRCLTRFDEHAVDVVAEHASEALGNTTGSPAHTAREVDEEMILRIGAVSGLIDLAFEPQGGDRVPGDEADRVLVVDEVRALG